MSMIKLNVGEVISLELQFSDGTAAMFPQALVYDPTGTLLATKNLTHVANGRYVDDTFPMPNKLYVAVTYIVYSDSGHTTLAPYGEVSDLIWRANLITSTLGVGSTTTTIACDRAETTTDYFKDALVRYLTGTLKGQVKKVGGYTTGSLTLASGFAFTAGGTAGDVVEIIVA